MGLHSRGAHTTLLSTGAGLTRHLLAHTAAVKMPKLTDWVYYKLVWEEFPPSSHSSSSPHQKPRPALANSPPWPKAGAPAHHPGKAGREIAAPRADVQRLRTLHQLILEQFQRVGVLRGSKDTEG